MLRSLQFKRACLRSDPDSVSELIYLSYLELNIRSLKGTVWLVSTFLLIYFPSSLCLSLLSAICSEISWHRLYPVLNFTGSVSLDILGIATGAAGIKSQRVIDSRLAGFCAQMYICLSIGIGIYVIFWSVLMFENMYAFDTGGFGLYQLIVSFVAIEVIAAYHTLQTVRLHEFVEEFVSLNPERRTYMSRRSLESW